MYKPNGGPNGEKNEKVLNIGRLNALSDSTIAMSGTALSGVTVGTIRMSGTNPRIAGPLHPGILYKYVSPVKTNAVASSSPTFSATLSYEYIPADTPTFHFAVSGSSEYISAIRTDGTDVDFYLSIVERSEG